MLPVCCLDKDSFSTINAAHAASQILYYVDGLEQAEMNTARHPLHLKIGKYRSNI